MGPYAIDSSFLNLASREMHFCKEYSLKPPVAQAITTEVDLKTNIVSQTRPFAMFYVLLIHAV